MKNKVSCIKVFYWLNVTANTYAHFISYFAENSVFYCKINIVNYSTSVVITLHISHN